ncbi:MAG TPA: XamI family restriction endonuclease [Stellaceae bacterium]|nr:XamI family restriction endonuclease [Stellaceae bacterium]
MRTPMLWSDLALRRESQAAVAHFVKGGIAEPGAVYWVERRESRRLIMAFFRSAACGNNQVPDAETARGVLLEPRVASALRWLIAPSSSEVEIGGSQILALICRLADSERFPWLARGRKPKPHEIKQALRATSALHAAQSMQTERRAYGKAVEGLLRDRLLQLGHRLLRTPNGGRITAPMHMPGAKSFYGECSVHGRRTDLLIGLSDGRAVAVEAKGSSSVVNSVKRVLNDTAAKARHWRERFGETLVPVALLSGVYGIDSLRSAQASGLYLVWSHELDSFVDWLASQ